jgi:hypothetical protein
MVMATGMAGVSADTDAVTTSTTVATITAARIITTAVAHTVIITDRKQQIVLEMTKELAGSS